MRGVSYVKVLSKFKDKIQNLKQTSWRYKKTYSKQFDYKIMIDMKLSNLIFVLIDDQSPVIYMYKQNKSDILCEHKIFISMVIQTKYNLHDDQ